MVALTASFNQKKKIILAVQRCVRLLSVLCDRISPVKAEAGNNVIMHDPVTRMKDGKRRSGGSVPLSA